MGITRRELLKHFGQGAACLAVSEFLGLKMALGQSAGESLSQEFDYRSWEDLYRKKWTWDKIVHSTHSVGCSAQCEWNVFVKDGVAFKEEQIEHPRSTNPENPDPGPQGCQRGACHTNQMYGPDRIKYPLKRVGQRGEGKWMRVSWDEALTEAADAMIDAIVKDNGPHSIIFDGGDQTDFTWGRFNQILGNIRFDSPVSNGDQNMGYHATFGGFGLPNDISNEGRRNPFHGTGPGYNIPPVFNADLVFIWHWNPVYTAIPYFKEFTQARYRGAEIVTIAPDLSASAVHSDYWVPVEPGTDIALALGMCQVIVEENLYKPEFLKEQTDFPLLVREDTHKFLRQAELEPGGRDDQFYVYDRKAKKIVQARRDTLDLGSVDPALEGRYEVELADGRKVEVRPVFEQLKERLNDYKPEVAAGLISRPFAKVHPDVIRMLARKAGKAKSMRVTTRHNATKSYHVDLINRSIALFLVLSGHARPGGSAGGFFVEGGGLYKIFERMERPDVEAGVEVYNQRKAKIEQVMKNDPTLTFPMVQRDLAIEERKQHYRVPGWQWMYYRAGFKDRWDNKQWHDPHYRDFPSYVEEANRKGWYDGFIGPDKEPVPVPNRVLLSAGGNYMRRLTGSKVIYENFTPSLEKIIKVDYRMGTTTLYADLVLPCTGYYERVKVRRGVSWLVDKAVDPPGEAKSDWDIACLLTKKISERARQRGITNVYDSRREITLELDKLYDKYTINGGFKEGEEEKLADMIYRLGAKLGIYQDGVNLEEVRKTRGLPQRARPAPPFPVANRAKLPHPTLTRRMQFYLDHDWFIEAGEALPVFRPHPLLGGDYPFHQTGGHGRESVNTLWISNPLILRLTRGTPSLLMNHETAARLGIEDNEEVEVYNDAGLYRVRVKPSNLLRPNQVAIYHCWEKYQFSEGHFQAVNPCTAKPLMLVGDYGHLTYYASHWQPEVARRGARVNIRKINA